MPTFRTSIKATGKSTAGVQIPDDVIEELGAGKKPPVVMNVNGYMYRNAVATVDGNLMVGLSADHRAASGLTAGQDVAVVIELDTQPRTVDVPPDFQKALDAEPTAQQTFEKLSNSLKRLHVDPIAAAKSDETRQRRIAKSIALLRTGKAR